MSGWAWDRADYHVMLVDGRVTACGPGTIRAAPAPSFAAFVLIPSGSGR
jgi:hypothetical protein